MTPFATHVIATKAFQHNGRNYEVVAAWDGTRNTVHIEARLNGAPIAVTYPDGVKAARVYAVDLPTIFDMKRALGVDAVAEMMNTAEADVRQLDANHAFARITPPSVATTGAV